MTLLTDEAGFDQRVRARLAQFTELRRSFVLPRGRGGSGGSGSGGRGRGAV